MGWKSTRIISREEAIGLLLSDMAKVSLKTNEELSDLMGFLFGDDYDKPYYGRNFIVQDEVGDDDGY